MGKYSHFPQKIYKLSKAKFSHFDRTRGVKNQIFPTLDKTFAGRSTEFKFLIPSKRRKNRKTKEEAFFQILKMPFQNSVTTRLPWKL